MKFVEHEIARPRGPVFTVGAIIHNPRVVAGLEKRGVLVAGENEFDFPPDTTVVLPTHGVPVTVRAKLERTGVTLIDAVCPRVTALHDAVRAAIERNRRIIIAGDAAHAETAAVVSISPRSIKVVSNADEARALRPGKRPVFLAAQTTFSPAEFGAIAAALSDNFNGIEVHRSLCPHTLKAQAASRELAARSDAMVVIGGRNSANTARLAEACRGVCARVFVVEGPVDLRKSNFRGVGSVGITAGASTPPEHIQEIADWLKKNFACKR